MNIEEILTKHVKEDGTFDKEAAAKELSEQLPKSFVPKHTFNEQSEQLKVANETLKQLEEKQKDNDALQKELEGYKVRVEEMETKAAQNELRRIAEDALRTAGASDLDYALYKLGTLESDGNGGVKDLDNKIKDLQASAPSQFQEKDPLDGYHRVANNLKHGETAPPNEVDAMIAAMTADIQK